MESATVSQYYLSPVNCGNIKFSKSRSPRPFQSKRILVAFGIFPMIVAAIATESTKKIHYSSRELTSSLVCHVTMECVSVTKVGDQHLHQDHHFECSPVVNGTVSDISYMIELPNEIAMQNREDLVGGTLFVQIPGGQIVSGEVVIPEDSMITTSSAPESFESRRRRMNVMGTRSLLVLRISALDTTPDYSAEEIYDFIFNETKPTLKSQYSKCSAGKLNFLPTQYGVMEVHVNLAATGATSTTIRDAAISTVTSQLGVTTVTELADHVMFCIPPGTGNWAGGAPVNHWRTVLNNKWCGYLSGIMHEMGHNLGLLHANEGGFVYRDFTSYMSAGFARPFYPVKCFNGANNWQFGWYSDRQVAIEPAGSGQMIKLATFVDYSKGSMSAPTPVLLRVGNSTFLQYNRVKDFNVEASIMIDQVTIVQQQGNGTSLLSGINASDPLFIVPNFEGGGQNVVFYVCGQGSENDTDWILISVGYGQTNNCIQSSTFQSSNPTQQQPFPPHPAATTPGRRPSRSTHKEGSKSLTAAPLLQPINTTLTPTLLSAVRTSAPTTTPALQDTLQSVQPIVNIPTSASSLPSTSSQHVLMLPTTLPTQAPSTRPMTEPPFPSSPAPYLMTISPSRQPTPNPVQPSCVDDASALFIVGAIQRNCEWMRLRPSIWPRECKPGKPAHEYCRELCNNCITVTTSSPTSASLKRKRAPRGSVPHPDARDGPAPLASNCSDSTVALAGWNNITSNVTCTELRARPTLRNQLCTRQDIKDACAETCGACKDCSDQIGLFYDNQGVQRTCLWLSVRYNLWGEYCRSGEVAFTICRQTCGNCLAFKLS